MEYAQIRVYKKTNAKLRKISKRRNKTGIIVIDELINAEIDKLHNV